VAALRVPGGATISRKEIDDYTRFVGNYGARGLAWIKVNDLAAGVEGLQSPILKFMPEAVVSRDDGAPAGADGDIVFFGADRAAWSTSPSAPCACKVGTDLGMVADGWAPLWVVDFPMFEDDGDGGWTPLHHPSRRRPAMPRRCAASRRGPVARLRHGAQRHGTRRWQYPYPRRRDPGGGVRHPRHR
jgi:aspartyl-tRNA synthetase